MRVSRWSAVVCLLATATCAGWVVSGCGESDAGDGGGAERASLPPAANEPPAVFVRRLANLLETTEGKKQCEELNQITLRSYTGFPCPPPANLRKSMATFKMGAAAAYGTGGVVDYTSGGAKSGAAIVLTVDPSRRWSVMRFGIFGNPTVGTSDKDSKKGFDEAVDAYLKAVRERDCPGFSRVVLLSAADKAPCKGEFASTKKLANKMTRNPEAEPEYIGGNKTFGFYALETRRPVPANVTIGVAHLGPKAGRPYQVLGASASPTAAEQRAKPKEQQEEEPERSKSRKAD
jgi:hypothetical protein